MFRTNHLVPRTVATDTRGAVIEASPLPSGQHVLIVEDDPMLRSFLQILLDSEGYRVSEAETGEEMFQVLDEGTVDLIVLDIMLPDGNGVDFARRLRRSSLTPIVFATAVTDTDTRRRAFGLMNVDYVNKPFDAKELLHRVSGILNGAPVVMEDPRGKERPRPPADTLPWYRAPLIWGPAMALVFIVVGGIFLIPKEEDPALPRKVAVEVPGTAAGPSTAAGAGAGGKETAIPGSGIVMRDAEPAPGTAAGGVAAGAPGGAAGVAGGGVVADAPLEAKIASEHFNNNSIPRILRYVRFVHRNDWGEYLVSWEQRLKNVQDLEAAGKSVELQNKGQVLSGKELTEYVALMERRVRYLRCAQQIVATAK